MKPRVCPVTGKEAAEVESKCPMTRLFNWCKWRVSSAISTLPFHKKNTTFDQLALASVAFSDLLLEHEEYVGNRLISRADMHINSRKPKNRTQALEKLFVEYHTNSNGLLCEDCMFIFREVQIDKRGLFLNVCQGDAGTYTKISNAYQIGMKIIYDIWRDIFRAFIVRYGRTPTPDELQSFEPFIMTFARTIGQTPAIFSVPIREHLTNVQAAPNLFFDSEGALQFDDKKLKYAQYIAHEEVSKHTNEGLQPILTNRYCPALPRIPKIAQMCCNIFRTNYSHVYNQFEQ
jgi:hypothetical protein